MYKTQELDAYASSDPTRAYRYLDGLTRVNEHLQQEVSKVVNPHKSKITMDSMPRYLQNAEDPVVFTFRPVDGGDAHAISVSKVFSAGIRDPSKLRTTYMVADGNLGVIPCATLAEAQDIVRVSANRFLGTPPDNSDFSGMRVSAYQMSKEIQTTLTKANALNKNVNRSFGDGAQDAFSYKHFFDPDGPSPNLWAKSHAASESPNWKFLLPEELAKRSIDGGYNIDSDIKGADREHGMTPKKMTLVEEMVALASKRQVSCVEGSCEFDLKRYIDDTFEPSGIKREPPLHSLNGDSDNVRVAQSTEELIYAKMTFNEEGNIGRATGRAVYTDMDDLPPPVPSRRGATGAKHSAQIPPFPEFDPDQVIYSKINTGGRGQGRAAVTADQLSSMRANVESEIRAEAAARSQPGVSSRTNPYYSAFSGESSIIVDDDIPPPLPRSRPRAAVVSEMESGHASALTGKHKRHGHRSNGIDADHAKVLASAPRRAAPPPPDGIDTEHINALTGAPRRAAPPPPDEIDAHVRTLTGEQSQASNVALQRGAQLLEAAAAAEGSEEGASSVQRFKRRAAVKHRGAASAATASQEGEAVKVAFNRGGESSEFTIEAAKGGNRRDRFKNAGAQLAQQYAQEEIPPPIPSRNRNGQNNGIAYGPGQAKAEEKEFLSVKELTTPSDDAETMTRAASSISAFDDPDFLKVFYLGAEELQVENQRILAISNQVEAEVANVIRAQGYEPDDWQLIKPSSDVPDSEFSFTYRGTDPDLQGTTKTVPMSPETKSRWEALNSDIQSVKSRIAESTFVAKVQQIAASKTYRRMGKALGLASKAMNLYSLYVLYHDADNLKNLKRHYQLSFTLGAIDTVLDLTSNTLNLSNKLLKVAAASTALQSTARAVSQLSAAVGMGASIGSIVAHGFALGTAKTPFEKDMAATNLAFSAAGLVLSTIAMAFPIAGPLIALISLMLFAIQTAVMHYKIEQEKLRIAGEQFDGFFEDTEKLMEILELIAAAQLEDVKVVGTGSQQRIIIEQKSSATIIEIHSERISVKRKEDAFSVVFLDNTQAELVPGMRNLPYLVECKTGGACYANIPEAVQEFAKNSGMNFQQGGKKAKQVAAVGYRTYNYTKREVSTNAVVPCLLLNKDSTGGVINETLFNQDFKGFLNHNFTLLKEGKEDRFKKTGQSTIMLTELYPKLKLMSNMEKYRLDKYQSQYSKTSNKPRTNAVTNQCKAKYTAASAADTCSAVQGQGNDVCVSNRTFDWAQKASSIIYPKNAPASRQNKQVAGVAAYLAKDSAPTFTTEEQNLMSLQQIQVATPIDSVALEPAKSKIQINLRKDDPKNIVILPERYSTEFLTKRLKAIVLSPPQSHEKEKKAPKAMALPIHENTKKYITEPTAYHIDMNANGAQNIMVGLGARIVITEKDSRTPYPNKKGIRPKHIKRIGSYRISFFPTNSKEEKDKIIEGKQNKIESLYKEMESQRKIVEEQIKIKEENKPRITNDYCRKTRTWLEWCYDDYQDRIQRCKDNAQAIVNNADNIFDAQRNRANAIRETRNEIDHERTILHSNNKQFIIRVSRTEIPATPSSQNIIISMGSAKTDDEMRKNNYLELFTSARVEIKDCQRDIFIPHKEFLAVWNLDYDQKEYSIACEFKINKTNGTVSLETMAELNTVSNGVKALAGIYKQLKNNNNDINIPSNLIVGTFDFSNTEKYELGLMDNDESKEQQHNLSNNKHAPTENKLNLNDRFEGHALAFDIDNPNKATVVNVIVDKKSYQQNKKLLRKLQFLGKELVSDINTVPPEYRKLFKELLPKQRYVYTLFEKESGLLVKQWFNAPIRLENPDDVQYCGKGTSPKRFTQAGKAAATYDCATDDYLSLIDQIKKVNNTTLLDVLEGQAKALSYTPLKLLNTGLTGDNGAKTPLLMLFNGGTDPNMLLMKKEPDKKAGIITVDAENGFAVTGKEIEPEEGRAEAIALQKLNIHRASLNLQPAKLLTLTAQPLLCDEELSTFLNELVKEQATNPNFSKGMPAKLIQNELDKGVCLNDDIAITAVRNGGEGKLIIETLNGIAFSASNDFREKHLIGVSSDFWRENGIDTDNAAEVLEKYKELVASYGAPQLTYIKLSDGEPEVLLPSATSAPNVPQGNVNKTMPPTEPATTKPTTTEPTTLQFTSTTAETTTTEESGTPPLFQLVNATASIPTNSSLATTESSTIQPKRINPLDEEHFNRTQAEDYLKSASLSDLNDFFSMLNATFTNVTVTDTEFSNLVLTNSTDTNFSNSTLTNSTDTNFSNSTLTNSTDTNFSNSATNTRTTIKSISRLEQLFRHFNVNSTEQLYQTLNITPTNPPSTTINLTTLPTPTTSLSTSQPNSTVKETVAVPPKPIKKKPKIKKAPGDEKIVYLNTINNQLLYIPRTNMTSSRTAIIGTLSAGRRVMELTALDPENEVLVSVFEPSAPEKVYQASAFHYQFFNSQGDHAYLALSPGEKEQQLPYLPISQLVMLPQQILSEQEGGQQASIPAPATPLRISQIMQQQLKIVTVVPAKQTQTGKNKSEVTSKLVVTGDKRPVKSFISEDTQGKKIFYVALPTKLLGKDNQAALSYLTGSLADITTTHLLVRLYDAFDKNGELRTDVQFDIQFNGESITTPEKLKKLLQEAKGLKE
ncbi:MAG: hypothetical protein ACRCSC_04665 [Lactococcus garvieae]